MSLYPPAKQKMDPKDYERVPVGNFVTGTIAEVEHEPNHEFKGQYASIDEAVRLRFEIDGLKFPHSSRWMKFSYGEKANLYKKYILPLVENPYPDLPFDLTSFNGMRVKMVWMDDLDKEGLPSGYQSIQLILPLEKKLLFHAPAIAAAAAKPPVVNSQTPTQAPFMQPARTARRGSDGSSERRSGIAIAAQSGRSLWRRRSSQRR